MKVGELVRDVLLPGPQVRTGIIIQHHGRCGGIVLWDDGIYYSPYNVVEVIRDE